MEEVVPENLTETNLDYSVIEPQPQIEISEEVAEAVEPAVLSEGSGEAITLPEQLNPSVFKDNELIAELAAMESQIIQSEAEEANATTPTPVKDEDDSDLYTIRHFSI